MVPGRTGRSYSRSRGTDGGVGTSGMGLGVIAQLRWRGTRRGG